MNRKGPVICGAIGAILVARAACAYTQHASELPLLKYDPLLDQLHGDPRFEALLQKVIGD